MQFTLTNAGQVLAIRGMAGDTIRFTKVKIGDNDTANGYKYVEDPKAMTDLVHPVHETAFDSIAVEDGHAKLVWTVNTEDLRGLGSKYVIWSETGIYAADPDGGEDILYAYNTTLDKDPEKSVPEVVQPGVKLDYETYISQEISVYVGDTVDVEAEIRKYLPYAPNKDFEDHLKADNPHGITWKGLGLTREKLGFHFATQDVESTEKYYSEVAFYISFDRIPKDAMLFFSYTINDLKDTAGSPSVIFEQHKVYSNITGWKIVAKMYNFTGTVHVAVLGIGGTA